MSVEKPNTEKGPVLVEASCGQRGHASKRIRVARMNATVGDPVGESCREKMGSSICGRALKVVRVVGK